MNHPICHECQTVSHCSRNGCIPITQEPEPPSRCGVGCLPGFDLHVMQCPLSAPDPRLVEAQINAWALAYALNETIPTTAVEREALRVLELREAEG